MLHSLPLPAQEEAAQKVAEAEQQLGELSQEVQQYRDLNERYRQISEENRQLYNTVQVRGCAGACEGVQQLACGARSRRLALMERASPYHSPCCSFGPPPTGPARQHPRVLPRAATRAHRRRLGLHGGGATVAVACAHLGSQAWPNAEGC